MMPGTTVPFDQQAIAATGRERCEGNTTGHRVDACRLGRRHRRGSRLCGGGLDMGFLPLLEISEGALEMCPSVVRISNEVEEIA